ncbi:MAG: hypothetical protein R3F39_11730 [Myxococcota bacterium]
MLLPQCAHTQQPRTIITASGELIRLHDRSYGCGGEVVDSQVHRQAAGGIAIHHETNQGLRVGGSVDYLRGALHSYSGDDPFVGRSPYGIGSLGFRIGSNVPNRAFTFDAGLRLYLARWRVLYPMPWLWARIGNPQKVWGEVRGGPSQGAFDPVIFGGGVGFIAGMVTVRGGFAFTARRFVDQFESDSINDLAVYADVSDSPADPAGYLHLRFNPSRYFSFGIYTVLGKSPSGQLTLSFAIPHEDSEPLDSPLGAEGQRNWETRQAE